VLDARRVTMRFGGLVAVNEVSLTVDDREIVGLIGPNGAGKTTFFNCLTGLYIPTSGDVIYRGSQLPAKSHRVTQAGIARTFQNIRLFPNMTVLENVQVGRHSRMKEGMLSAILRGPGYRRAETESRDHAQELLDFVGLSRVAGGLARNLPYGDQRRLEIARALASDPGLLLLDEPTAGMNPQETRQTQELVLKIREQGLSIVVISTTCGSSSTSATGWPCWYRAANSSRACRPWSRPTSGLSPHTSGPRPRTGKPLVTSRHRPPGASTYRPTPPATRPAIPAPRERRSSDRHAGG